MKAFLLAAGTGSRLRPITDHTPKCMLPIGGTLLLDLWLDALHRAEVDEVLVNLHHLPDIVLRHLQARSGPPAIRTAFEPELLGSAGTLRHHRAWVQDEEFFLAFNADNLTDFDLRCLIDFHRGRRCRGNPDRVPCRAPVALRRGPSRSLRSRDRLHRKAIRTSGQPGQRRHVCLQSERASRNRRHHSERHRAPASSAPRGTDARALPVEGYFCDIGTPEAYQDAVRAWRPKVLS